MTRQSASAARVKERESAFKCPLCESPMRVADFKSLICSRNHTFDFTKQGYLNLSARPVSGKYTKELFEARRKIITESSLYASVHKEIARAIEEHRGGSADSYTMADLGCGEGSHLHRILEECGSPGMTGIGLDLSKEGIVMASKRYEGSIWIVGDLAKSPLSDKSLNVVLNILSPSNYKEFKRILVQHGLVIKVVPRPGYLKELREALYDREEKKKYRNDETAALFRQHFILADVVHLNYTKELNQAELENMVRMTPLAWSGNQARIYSYINLGSAEITVDLDILIGINKQNDASSR
ncbi:23S rRNA (guanine745-N1)-methyltransferase [Paenibacillus sophorae]|uniref:23S rRNA (Guanine745-N1)-methyltransferase n=1 Tax=Paenibacillus sophorae TaxID=1333845 RepID=A0A1H8Q4U4_9BACL|nr:methyltransferase domain-containing protein [Paenibacillus sophorae]QWU15267.1 methyltransferase domain-containing protein [Paenibacillus sophorae]SEO49265.1 23S rRNA (guanine745-N1)-methyltransferase [Paenibacillus sophorae]